MKIYKKYDRDAHANTIKPAHKNKFHFLIEILLLILSSSAFAITSTGEEKLTVGDYSSTVWEHDFVGTKWRELTESAFQLDLSQTEGGFDTGVGPTFSKVNVDDVHSDFKVSWRYAVSGSGAGNWWYGPKVSVNWQDEGSSDGAAGWYENYVIENASRTPAFYHDRLSQGAYLGETNHDGGIYKHYVYYYADWTQYWAIRQTYRNAGTTSMGPILNHWRANGLPNKLVDGIRLNLEAGGENERVFDIDKWCFPAGFSMGGCDADVNIVGNKRVKDGWKARYMHASGTAGYSSVKSAVSDESLSEQKWVFEHVSGDEYRIKNTFNGHYLKAPNTSEWSTLQTAPLNNSWSSQKWIITETDGGRYKIKNRWSKLFVTTTESDFSNIKQAADAGWSSQKYHLEDY